LRIGLRKQGRVPYSQIWIVSLLSVRQFLRTNFRLLAELGRRKALAAGAMLYVIAAAIGRRGQEADFGDDDLRAVAALAGLPIIPGTRPQRAFDIEPRSLADVIAQDLGRALESDQVVPLGVLLPIAVDVPVAFAGGERQVNDCAGAQNVDRRILATRIVSSGSPVQPLFLPFPMR